MYIKKVILTNYGPHRRLEVSFENGLIGIFGPNGKGKSYLVEGIYACLTNDFSRFPGGKEANICDLAGPDEPSNLHVIAEHNGVTFEVFRSLRKTKGLPEHCLNVGSESFKKAPEIEQELASRLGVNKRLIGTYCFVLQWRMFDFLSQQPAERAVAYQLLCGTQKAKVICDAIDKALEQYPDLTLDVIDTTTELQQKLANLESQAAGVNDEHAVESKSLLPVDKVDKAKSIRTKRTNYDRLLTEKETTAARVQLHTDQVETERQLRDRRQSLVTEVEALVKDLQAAAEVAHRDLAKAEQAGRLKAQRLRLQGQLEQAQATVTAAGEAPVLHKDDKLRENLVRQQMTEQDKLERNREILVKFDKTGVTECPTCGTPVTTLDSHLRELRIANAQSEKHLPEVQRKIGEIDKARAAVNTFTVADSRKRQAVATLEAQLASVGEVQDVDVDEAALREDIRLYNEQEANLKNAQKISREAEIRFNTAQTLLGAAQQRLAEINADIIVNTVSNDLFERASSALERHDAARLRCSVLLSRLETLQADVGTTRQELDTMQLRLDRNRKAKKFGERLRRMRAEVFHHQCLPQRVAQQNLQDMEIDINSELENFGRPFWVEASENLSFIAHFPGAPPRPAERLSGGQKMVLAWAFRVANQQLFDAELGFMSLDEPTAGVDAANREGLAEALVKYAATVRGKRQVIIISHSDELRPAFDQVIDLGVAAA